MHSALMILFGIAIIRAVVSYRSWLGWALPVPTVAGSVLLIVTGDAVLLTMLNLAVKGLGAPFAVALSPRLTADWSHAWTRNPMLLALLAFLVAPGIRLQSTLFVLWVGLLVTPAWLVLVKVFEERELEDRFGAPYLEYKARTPMLLPR